MNAAGITALHQLADPHLAGELNDAQRAMLEQLQAAVRSQIDAFGMNHREANAFAIGIGYVAKMLSAGASSEQVTLTAYAATRGQIERSK